MLIFGYENLALDKCWLLLGRCARIRCLRKVRLVNHRRVHTLGRVHMVVVENLHVSALVLRHLLEIGPLTHHLALGRGRVVGECLATQVDLP